MFLKVYITSVGQFGHTARAAIESVDNNMVPANWKLHNDLAQRLALCSTAEWCESAGSIDWAVFAYFSPAIFINNLNASFTDSLYRC
jgi:hypothetical protein